MIDTCQNHQLAERRLWSGYVKQLFQTLELSDRASAQDITESLAVFCQHHPHMPSRTLSLLMARSFCATGDTEAAGRVLFHDRTHRPHTDSWLEVLSSGYPFPELYPLFSSRALHPQSLTSAGTVWVLDFDKIRLTAADSHELILFQTVRVLTEKVSNVWKKTGGQGTLGVKGLKRLAGLIRPRGVQSSRQLLDYVSDVLARRARQNGWAAAPSVLLLDL